VVVTAHPGAEGQRKRLWTERQALNRGLGEAMAQAFEFAAIPVLFAALGWWLDSWLGTAPILVVTLSAVGFIGVSLRTIYHYKARTAKEEEGKPWTRRPR
jgi:F0F1-type ATP synthase assembly protein I